MAQGPTRKSDSDNGKKKRKAKKYSPSNAVPNDEPTERNSTQKPGARIALQVRTVLRHIGGGGAVLDRGKMRPLTARNTANQVIGMDRGALEFLITHGHLMYDPNESSPFCHGYTRTHKGRSRAQL